MPTGKELHFSLPVNFPPQILINTWEPHYYTKVYTFLDSFGLRFKP